MVTYTIWGKSTLTLYPSGGMEITRADTLEDAQERAKEAIANWTYQELAPFRLNSWAGGFIANLPLFTRFPLREGGTLTPEMEERFPWAYRLIYERPTGKAIYRLWTRETIDPEKGKEPHWEAWIEEAGFRPYGYRVWIEQEPGETEFD